MSENTNRCPHCGGQLVVEYIGSYGDVFMLGKNGEPNKKRIKRFIYEHYGEDGKMVYCWNCRKMPDEEAEDEDE